MALLPPLVPFFYSVLLVACLSSKILHLAQHGHSVGLGDFLIYLPTLFFQDLLVICLGRMLLRGPNGVLQLLGCILGTLIALVSYGAAASQFGFYWETGSQIEWGATGSFLRDPAAMKILFSGMRSVALSGAVMFTISYMTTPYLHTLVGGMLSAGCSLVWQNSNAKDTQDAILPTPDSTCPRRSGVSFRTRVSAIVVFIILVVLRFCRPQVPYDHLASTLPFSLSAAFHKSHHDCHPPPPPPFPFQDFVEPKQSEHPHGEYPGEHPGSAPDRPWPFSWPKWLPEDPPPGFSRWTKQLKQQDKKEDKAGDCEKPTFFYNAATDPSKVSNLDNPIYDKLREAFDKNSVQVEHIILLTLESARKDVFPMLEGSELYELMLSTFAQRKRAGAIDTLSMMTPTAQMLTGEYAKNSNGERNTFDDWSWKDRIDSDMGGINVKGAMTGSTLTLKSLLSSYCGVNPLPVDLLEEANLDIYQPCLPHIMDLFNSQKNDDGRDKDDFKERMWNSVFIQSSTDTYDRQALMTRRMGFNQSFVKGDIDNPKGKYFPPESEEINYFGYAEQELDPYVKDIIFSAAADKTRLFMSHMTVTTHHPWKLPSDSKTEDYFGEDRTTHRDLNAFLNTVHYVDRWVGKIIGYLEEAKIADKTLVVVVGDHGQAFEEDDWVQGTYENSHISNFKVPLVFRHPNLPRIEVEANATSLSILPTVLDLLVHSNSLNQHDTSAAESLVHEYQGQSLLRPFKNEHNGRQVWNMGVINAGGSLLAVTSAGQPYRLVVPLQNASSSIFHIKGVTDKVFEYRFTHTGRDPAERAAVESWTWDGLQKMVGREYGADAMTWTENAAKMARWWVEEQQRVWNY
ncbi:alkaline-phosphatase-like protein [Talaromyces proteolyticus]|uniref:Alkaline-phosphatase-like protein n=1 Tax=Talaromyces proteolyticus TaxID=1131652 RepID=A0AAD4KYK0_9EURO|nr:alkaline-phosphatase-like protein [Talaromyces proteolyticus]KAH8700200.1 alkaline-phosphatase-like protein [Talaromyces proteolyticus]